MRAIVLAAVDVGLAVLVSIGIQWIMPELRGQGPGLAATYLGVLAALRHYRRD
ncbi:hypothetical protein [Agrobacterium pusense]|uniref:hypothetical protein n=1 Tax=Agrobacterium pusense TaxID=648995 RepID=UPI00384D9BC8